MILKSSLQSLLSITWKPLQDRTAMMGQWFSTQNVTQTVRCTHNAPPDLLAGLLEWSPIQGQREGKGKMGEGGQEMREGEAERERQEASGGRKGPQFTSPLMWNLGSAPANYEKCFIISALLDLCSVSSAGNRFSRSAASSDSSMKASVNLQCLFSIIPTQASLFHSGPDSLSDEHQM